MLDAFAQPFVIDGTRLDQRASMGVVVWDAANTDCAEIVQNADVALFEAKRAGKDRYVIFSPDMQEQALDRFELVQDLRRGFQSDQFAMHYQPIVDLATTEVVGFEALMRWAHPERGMVPRCVHSPGRADGSHPRTRDICSPVRHRGCEFLVLFGRPVELALRECQPLRAPVLRPTLVARLNRRCTRMTSVRSGSSSR